PLEQVQNHDENDVFANVRRHSEQPESINDTYVLEKDDSNVIPDSSNICTNDNQVDQNAAECVDERAALANLIANLTLDTEENKTVLKQLKKANASLTQELKECKTNLDESSRALGEATSSRDSSLIALQTKQTDYKILQTKLNETLGLLALKDIDIKEGLKTKTNEISVVNQKHDELVKKSLLTRSQFEGQLKEKSKVISDLKVKEGKDIDTMIDMEKQLKFLNEILYKRNQSIQTIHMCTFANPKYCKKAQSDKPCLFCPDGEDTVTLEKESRSKLDKDKVKPYNYTYQNSLYETFKPPSKAYLDQLERAKEVRKTMWRKTFVRTKPNIAKNVGFLPMSKSISKSRLLYNEMTNNFNHFRKICQQTWSNHTSSAFPNPTAKSMEVLIKILLMPLSDKTILDSHCFIHELKKEMNDDLEYVNSLEKELDELESEKADFSNIYDLLLEECVSKDVTCSYLHSLSDLNANTELQCLYLHKVKECECLAQKLSNQTESVNKEVHNNLLKSFAKLEKHSISLELSLQHCKEQMKNNPVCKENASNVFRKEREQYHEIQDLKAQMLDKNMVINDVKEKLILVTKGKSVETQFDKPSVVRQPNAQRIPKPSVLGKPTPFSNSPEMRCFQTKQSVNKTNVSDGLFKPVTQQNLPQKRNQAVRNTNVLKPGMFRIASTTTQTKTPHSVSRPQLKSYQVKEKVVPNISQVKFTKKEVEDHHRISSISKKTKSVTACNDSSNLQNCLNGKRFWFWQNGNDLLTGNRGSDLYTISLQETTSSTPICFMAKASPTQAWLWHRRLSHLNFDYITLLSKKEVVTGLPKLKYVKDQLCSSCEMSKAKRSSFKTKAVPSSKGRLNLLHMDLCGPMRVASINGKKYILVIVDDYSRYTWTLFLRSKDETPEVLKDFLTMIQRNLQAQVITVRTDRGTEFLNKTLHAYFKEEGIEHQTSTPRTPEQNGVVERRNRTLVEAARTMLSASKLPLSFWAEAETFNKTPIFPFTSLVALASYLEMGENLDKMKEKRGIHVSCGIFYYCPKGLRVYNKRTRLIVESIHIRFDEIKEMMSDHNSSDLAPQRQEMSVENVSSGLVPQGQQASDYDNSDPMPPRQNVVPTAEKTDSSHQGLEFLFSPLLEEYYNPTHDQAEENNNDQAPNASFQEDDFINPFCTPVQEIGESSSRNIDNTNEHSFQPQSHDFRWTRDHPLEQVRGNPSMPVQTRRQLATDPEMLFGRTHCKMIIKLSGYVRTRRMKDQTVISNNARILVAKGYASGKWVMILKNHCSSGSLGSRRGFTLLSQKGFVIQIISRKVYLLRKALYGIKASSKKPAEAEYYVALSASYAQVMWMRTQLQDYGFNYNKNTVVLRLSVSHSNLMQPRAALTDKAIPLLVSLHKRTFRVILFSIHNDEWKSFQCHHQTALRDEEDDLEEYLEDPKECGEDKANTILGVIHDKLNNDWFNNTSEDEYDLEGILDYLKPRSHDRFIDLDDEAYNKRRCGLLGMIYEEPTPILIEKAKVTRYTVGQGETYTKVNVLGVEKIPRTRDNVATMRVRLMKKWPKKEITKQRRSLYKKMEFEVALIRIHVVVRCVPCKPSRDFTRPLGTPSGLKGLLHMLNATVIPTKGKMRLFHRRLARSHLLQSSLREESNAQGSLLF
ncbi:retrovirus-related pol polyprotein from transposon TNT 1-94, partial [Tanacetum coccineum]